MITYLIGVLISIIVTSIIIYYSKTRVTISGMFVILILGIGSWTTIIIYAITLFVGILISLENGSIYKT